VNESDTESSDSLVTALASTSISDSAWKSAPSYPPLYLSTLIEYLPPQTVPKLPKGLTVEDVIEKDKDVTWTKENYENSLGLDQVFEKFIQRVAIEGKQCIRFVISNSFSVFGSQSLHRYELGGTFRSHRTRCPIYSGLGLHRTPPQPPNLTWKLFGPRGVLSTPLKSLNARHATPLVCSNAN